MILRIEDTDRTRLVEDAVENLVESLRWAGITFDEGPGFGGDKGPYVQSERFDLYRQEVTKLIENGTAYYAFDTAEELDAMRERQQAAGIAPKYDRSAMRNQYTLGGEETARLIAENAPHVMRLKIPMMQDIRFTDIIRGEVVINGKDIDDQILLKSDGFPTYHLANVVDDHYMEITHVIRGEEWLPSTPKHVLLYEAFGWEAPRFAHLPLLLNENKSKLSKRHGDVAVEDFREKGYFAETMVNFVALLGWNPSADREIFSMDELIENFNLEKVNKAGAIFDRKKLEWMNSEYVKMKSVDEIFTILSPALFEAGVSGYSDDYVKKVIKLLKERVHFVHDLVPFSSYMFSRPEGYEADYMAKHWKEGTAEMITPLVEIYRNLDEWTHDSLHDATSAYMNENSLKFGPVMNVLRLMVTGKSVGASMFETMEILGGEECMARLDIFMAKKANAEI